MTSLLGVYLVREGSISEVQLRQALRLQAKGSKRRVGEICIKLGFCSVDDVDNAIACKNAAALKKRTSTKPAMAAFREAIAASKKATREHLHARIQTQP